MKASSKAGPPKTAPTPPPSAPKAPAAPPKASQASPPASPASPASEEKADGAHWESYKDVDEVYAIMGELSKRKVVLPDETIDVDVLNDYLGRIMKAAVWEERKFSEWCEFWAAMNIPVDRQAEVLRPLLQAGLESDMPEKMCDTLTELVKGHRCKIKAVEESVAILFECGTDQDACLSKFFFSIFPKSPTSPWGWSRVGWSWQQWWGTVDKILQALDSHGAFELLGQVLTAIETESGEALSKQPIWDALRLGKVRDALCNYGGLDDGSELEACVYLPFSSPA